MSDPHSFYYEPDEDEPLSTEVVTAIAAAHDEDVLAQEWLTSSSA